MIKFIKQEFADSWKEVTHVRFHDYWDAPGALGLVDGKVYEVASIGMCGDDDDECGGHPEVINEQGQLIQLIGERLGNDPKGEFSIPGKKNER